MPGTGALALTAASPAAALLPATQASGQSETLRAHGLAFPTPDTATADQLALGAPVATPSLGILQALTAFT